MRLLGKYTFETLRDCMQGTFSCIHNQEENYYVLQAWFITAIIRPKQSIELFIGSSKSETQIEIGKITLL